MTFSWLQAGFGDTPGEKVVVSFVGTDYPTTVGQDGTWEVQMNCCDYLTDKVLTVAGESNTLNYTNVACGQVFVCSGQSNMELPLSYVLGGEEEIAKADRPNWRLFRVPHTPSATPQADMIAEDPDTKMPAKWLVSNETNAAKFSAVCYLTAKHISEMLWGDAPFGLIWASWGGTRGEHRGPFSLMSGILGWSERTVLQLRHGRRRRPRRPAPRPRPCRRRAGRRNTLICTTA